MKAFVLVALVGCGRVNFDPRNTPVDAMLEIDGAFAGCTRDPFEAISSDWEKYGGESIVANGTLRVDLGGAMGDSSGLQRSEARSYVGWSTILRVLQPCAQQNAFTGIGWHPEAGEAIHLSILQSEIRFDLGDGGGPRSEYDPADDQWLRIRESGGLVYGATSPDGVDWNEFGSFSFDASNMHTDLGVDSPLVTVNPDFAIFDDYIECPP